MLGVVVGDVLGSVYERGRYLARSSELPPLGARFTDDTVFTLAVAESMLDDKSVATCFRQWGRRHAHVGASRRFTQWLSSDTATAYQGDTNGALMRVSPAIVLAATLADAQRQAEAVTAVTHDHPRALESVRAYCNALWAALGGASKDDVLEALVLPDDEGQPLDALHAAGGFRMKAAQTLADVRECLREADDFEQTMRNAIYIGGDVDTVCAVAGALAECLWGVPRTFAMTALRVLPTDGVQLLQRQYQVMTTIQPTTVRDLGWRQSASYLKATS